MGQAYNPILICKDITRSFFIRSKGSKNPNCFTTNQLVHIHHLSTTYLLPIYYLPTNYQLPINYLSTTYQLPINYLSTTYQLPINSHFLHLYRYVKLGLMTSQKRRTDRVLEQCNQSIPCYGCYHDY